MGKRPTSAADPSGLERPRETKWQSPYVRGQIWARWYIEGDIDEAALMRVWDTDPAARYAIRKTIRRYNRELWLGLEEQLQPASTGNETASSAGGAAAGSAATGISAAGEANIPSLPAAPTESAPVGGMGANWTQALSEDVADLAEFVQEAYGVFARLSADLDALSTRISESKSLTYGEYFDLAWQKYRDELRAMLAEEVRACFIEIRRREKDGMASIEKQLHDGYGRVW